LLSKFLIVTSAQVALSSTQISSSLDIQSLDPEARKCYFPQETQNLILQIHKTYSLSNCLLECSLNYSRQILKAKLNLTEACMPWYFPSNEDKITICAPWETLEFMKLFSNVPDGECKKCLADCNSTIYEPTISTLPFRRCDVRNQGVSPLCNVENEMVKMQEFFLLKN